MARLRPQLSRPDHSCSSSSPRSCSSSGATTRGTSTSSCSGWTAGSRVWRSTSCFCGTSTRRSGSTGERRRRDTAVAGGAPARRRLLARRELPLGRAGLPARQPAPARAAPARAHQAAAPRPLRHDAGPEPRLRPSEPRDQGSATSTRSTSRARATAGRRSSRTPTSKAPTASSTRTSAQSEDGLRRLFRQFSFPGGIPSHVAPEVPGSIHEGGELGYALVHAFGAAFDNPDLVVACVVGDGEAETGPAGGQLALEQVPEPADGRRRAADPPPERLQDRQPDRPRPDPGGRAAGALPRLRVGPGDRRGLGPRARPRRLRGDPGRRPRTDPARAGGGPQR